MSALLPVCCLPVCSGSISEWTNSVRSLSLMEWRNFSSTTEALCPPAAGVPTEVHAPLPWPVNGQRERDRSVLLPSEPAAVPLFVCEELIRSWSPRAALMTCVIGSKVTSQLIGQCIHTTVHTHSHKSLTLSTEVFVSFQRKKKLKEKSAPCGHSQEVVVVQQLQQSVTFAPEPPRQALRKRRRRAHKDEMENVTVEKVRKTPPMFEPVIPIKIFIVAVFSPARPHVIAARPWPRSIYRKFVCLTQGCTSSCFFLFFNKNIFLNYFTISCI